MSLESHIEMYHTSAGYQAVCVCGHFETTHDGAQREFCAYCKCAGFREDSKVHPISTDR